MEQLDVRYLMANEVFGVSSSGEWRSKRVRAVSEGSRTWRVMNQELSIGGEPRVDGVVRAVKSASSSELGSQSASGTLGGMLCLD
jgi:hypothetical protein